MLKQNVKTILTIILIFMVICLLGSLDLAYIHGLSYGMAIVNTLFVLVFLSVAPFIVLEMIWQYVLIALLFQLVGYILICKYIPRVWRGVFYSILMLNWLFFAIVFAVPLIGS